ncbi:MAG: hypothetical protein ABI591_25245 [Kofleriaceae bacterium]
MKTVLALVISGSTAFAAPKVCENKGQPLVALRHLGERKVPVVSNDTPPPAITGGFVIWPSGGYSSFEEDPDTNKVTNERAACLDKDDFKTVKAALAKATWKFTTAKIKCMAMSVKHTEWTANDKLVWDDKMCSGKIADAVTEKAIEIVKALETKATVGGPAVK